MTPLAKFEQRGFTDAELKTMMATPSTWRAVVAFALSGSPHSTLCHRLVARACRLYSMGAPCTNVKTGRVETLPADRVDVHRAFARAVKRATISKGLEAQRNSGAGGYSPV